MNDGVLLSSKGTKGLTPKIGRQLGVKSIVEGSVRKAEQKLRIMVRHADVATGFQIWSEVYTFELRDVFSTQEEISRAVTKALRTRVWGEALHHQPKRRASK